MANSKPKADTMAFKDLLLNDPNPAKQGKATQRGSHHRGVYSESSERNFSM